MVPISFKQHALLLGLALASPVLSAATIDFNRDIRAILSNNCFACHGPDEEERAAKLRLDTREGALRDLGGYAAIRPGKPDASELIARVTSSDPGEVMPPPEKGKALSPDEIRALKDWIAQGANYAVHWSYSPVNSPTVPPLQPGETAHNAVDHFVLRRARENRLTPASTANRETLARRAALDLTGLPPGLEELDHYLADTGNGAFERYVDRLLAKEAFGEHWAGMWLDLARYADSAGYPSDPGREIWAYRDWVIRAFNQNLPFDRFTLEQIAGDLMPDPTDSQLIATAFHRNTMTQNEGGTSDEEFRNEAVVDRVNTTMAVWMGTSMACAQCHTHKYDPITQEEYFRFFAILNNTEDADKRDESPLHRFYTPAQLKQREVWKKELADLDRQLASPKPEWLAGFSEWSSRLSSPLRWESATPTLARSHKGTILTTRKDGSIIASEPQEKDTYIVEIPLDVETLAAIKLEALTDPSLPKKGPGHSGGNFVIDRITAQVVPEPGQPRVGRFVRIAFNGNKQFLQLAEVQVFHGERNVAPSGTASQVSDYRDAVAARAIDGNTNGDYHRGSVSHTGGQTKNEWWEVKLAEDTPVDRIVLWNRTDGGAGARLKDFTVSLLDEQRREVWQKVVTESPEPDLAISIGGPIEVAFTAALADFEQKGFPAQSVIAAKPSKQQPGWAIAGGNGQPHHLALLTRDPVPVPARARLRVAIRQNSAHSRHLLGRFRISHTADERVNSLLQLPSSILATVQKDASKRSDPEIRSLQDHYLRQVAPETRRQRSRLSALQKSLASQKQTTVPILRELDGKQRRVTRVQIRGNFQSLAEEVSEGVPAAFHPLPQGSQADRTGLARWLTSPDNPLTARVTVNRFWERLFGTGLVRTSEEFGSQGEPPSHPELLDWMAAEFMESGWDVKHLLKLIVTSATWRQSSRVTPEALAADPDNRLLARGPRFRATGEVLRDQALFVSGLLSDKMYGEPVRPLRPNLGLKTAFGGANDWTPSQGDDAHRRSLYTLVKRNSPYPSFTTFDAPSREVCTLRRSRSNTPLQAFVTLNDPVFVEAAQGFARRILAEGGDSDAARMEFAFRVATSRQPTPAETARLLELLQQARSLYAGDMEQARKMATDPLGDPGKDADLKELASWTAVANVILNLDEMIMRR